MDPKSKEELRVRRAKLLAKKKGQQMPPTKPMKKAMKKVEPKPATKKAMKAMKKAAP